MPLSKTLINMIRSAITVRLLSTQKAIELNSEKIYKNKVDAAKPAGWDQALPFESIPGPKGLPLIGNVWRFLPQIGDLYGMQHHDMINWFYQQYGDISCLRGIFNRKPMVLLFNPEEIAKVYRNEGPWPIRDSLHSVKYFRKVIRKDLFEEVGSGLGTENGEAWLKFRSLVNPILMQPRALKQYVSKIDEIAAELVDNMKFFAKNDPKQEMPKNFLHELYKYTLESVGLISLDKRFGCLNRNEKLSRETQNIITFTNESFDLMYLLDVRPSLWRWYSTPNWKRFVYITNYLVDTFMRYINEESAKLKQRTHATNEEASVFQKLIDINPKVAVIMTLDMLMAGTDTTGKVIGAGLYYLAADKKSQRKLREELLKLLPSKSSPITSEVLDQAHYLKAVVKEITRLATIAVGNVRTTVKDTVLAGYQIPERTNVFMGHFCISTRTDKYFPKAEMFIPERWLRSNNTEISNKNVNPFVSLPFGFGPRSCIGKRFAVLEIEVALAKIIRNFELDWHYPKMEFETTVLYGIANPLKIQIIEISE